MFPSLSRLAPALILVAGLAVPATAASAQDGISGPYLSAISAERRGDLSAAARYYAEAVRVDPGQPGLRHKAMIYGLAAGDVAGALRQAEALDRQGLGGAEVALFLAVEEMRAGAFSAALRRLETAEPKVSPALVSLLGGWAASVDDMTRADILFDQIGASGSLAALAAYHKAMARAVAGDLEAAARILEVTDPGIAGSLGRALEGWAQVLAATGRQQAALAILDEALAGGFEDPGLARLRDRIAAGEAVSFTLIPNATMGVADALYGAAAIAGRDERNSSIALIYSRLSLHLDPSNDAARIEAGSQLMSSRQNDLAIEVLAGLPDESPQYLRGQVMRADALTMLDRADEAIAVLVALQRDNPASLLAANALAQVYHREERWTDAAMAYGLAIGIIGEDVQRRHWPVFYRRGIAHERSGQWDLAEADFRRALELEPDQASVLNYLGYSLVELGQKLGEAEEMIRKAVELEPDNGFITDSLAWVLYRLGRYEEAVAPMERAVELEPTDPILNDHLGDILWMVGRRMEARFQWRRALSFEPEEKEIPRIRRKLEIGLDRVLEEERTKADTGSDTPGNGG